MLLFRKIQLEDKSLFENYTKDLQYTICDYSFTALFAWKDYYNVEIAINLNALYIKMKHFNYTNPIFYFPITKDDTTLEYHLQNLEEYTKNNKISLIFTCLEERQKNLLSSLRNDYIFENIFRNADYIYLAESLKTLSGKPLKNKRNLVNQFKNTYLSRYSYHNINKIDKDEILDLLNLSNDVSIEDELSLKYERKAIELVLDNLDYLDIKGGVLKIDNKIVAFSLGTVNKNQLIVHFEKANPNIIGCYQMINYLFVNNHITDDIVYINREEDLGITGLVQAKKSYNPIKMGVNYNAYLKNLFKITVADNSDLNQIIKTFKQAFSSDSFCDYYFDNIYKSSTTYIHKLDNRAVSILSVYDFKTSNNKDVKYLYSLATKKAFLRQGLMRDLINSVDTSNSCLILENSSLVPFYEKLGFKVFVRGYIDIFYKTNIKEDFDIRPLNKDYIDDLDLLYNNAYPNNIIRKDIYKHLFSIYCFYGIFINDSLEGYLVYDSIDKMVKEIITTSKNLTISLLNFITHKLNIESILFFNTIKGEKVYYSTKDLEDENLYINLLFN